jgi:hypothetical protein
VILVASSLEAGDAAAGEAALARLRGLAGEWHGSFEWTGARTDKGEMSASYYVTGRGATVVENLSTDGSPMMTSTYHLDGADLRVTHFCAAQNQPRLKAEHIDVEGGAIDFAFVDITNLKSPDAPHVVSISLRLVDDDTLTIRFGFVGGGKKSEELISLERGPRKTS